MHSLRALALPLVAATIAFAAPAYAGGTEEQREACTNDAFKFCSAHFPDEGAIESCLRQNQARLSSPCRMVMQQPAPADATPRLASRHGGGVSRGQRHSGGNAAMGAVAGMMQILPAIAGEDSIFDAD